MKKHITTSVIMILIVSINLSAALLKWDIKIGDRLEIVKTADVEFLVNKELDQSYSERNIIDLTCYNKLNNEQFLKGVFTLYHKDKKETLFKKIDSFKSDFSINNNGKYSVSAVNLMPNERNIPTFPQRELKTTDEWSAPAQIILNSFSRNITLDITVNYRLGEIKKHNENKLAIVFYEYKFKEDFSNKKIYPEDAPDGIVIQNEGVFLWNLTKNIPIASEDNYYTGWLFIQSEDSYSMIEHKMKMKATYSIFPTISEDQKEKAKTELAQNLNKEKGITVTKNESGLVIRMGEVLFDFNSFVIKEETASTLQKITDIVKSRYPDSEVIIEGHTDNIGTDEYNQKLSEKRAKSVADYIKNNISHDKLSYKGYGKERPLNTNKDAEERKVNRRVDIIIKLN